MFRSFSKRIIGGVCGGLANRTPLNAWIWRLLFVLLVPLTGGVAALAYLVLWWMLPLDSPLRPNTGGVLRGLLALVLSIAIIAGWFARTSIAETAEFDLYPWLLLLLLGIVFGGKQIARGYLALGVVSIATPLLLVLGQLDVLPAGLYDLLQRSWPALLVFLGLAVVLRYRTRFSGFISLAISAMLVFGLGIVAFSSRQGEQRTEQQVILSAPTIDEHNLASISEEITTLQINLSTLDTDVQISIRAGDERVIGGEFLGGNNSRIDLSYSEEGSIATLTIEENLVNDIPLLEDIGRGSLRLELPPSIALGFAFLGQRGDANFDLASLDLERLDMTLISGNAFVTLPAYQPLSPSVQERPGAWTLIDGNLTVTVPEDLGMRFLLRRGDNPEPSPSSTYDDLLYRVELSGEDYILVSRRYDALEIQRTVRLDVLGGSLRILSSE